ncbi:hypothetical protein BDR26DRAFT_713862 [Obelidium mucronatum]|nr:hypothetical protein BDR26DRAFT_713862 [Obelidium mucronatum]
MMIGNSAHSKMSSAESLGLIGTRPVDYGLNPQKSDNVIQQLSDTCLGVPGTLEDLNQFNHLTSLSNISDTSAASVMHFPNADPTFEVGYNPAEGIPHLYFQNTYHQYEYPDQQQQYHPNSNSNASYAYIPQIDWTSEINSPPFPNNLSTLDLNGDELTKLLAAFAPKSHQNSCGSVPIDDSFGQTQHTYQPILPSTVVTPNLPHTRLQQNASSIPTPNPTTREVSPFSRGANYPLNYFCTSPDISMETNFPRPSLPSHRNQPQPPYGLQNQEPAYAPQVSYKGTFHAPVHNFLCPRSYGPQLQRHPHSQPNPNETSALGNAPNYETVEIMADGSSVRQIPVFDDQHEYHQPPHQLPIHTQEYLQYYPQSLQFSDQPTQPQSSIPLQRLPTATSRSYSKKRKASERNNDMNQVLPPSIIQKLPRSIKSTVENDRSSSNVQENRSWTRTGGVVLSSEERCGPINTLNLGPAGLTRNDVSGSNPTDLLAGMGGIVDASAVQPNESPNNDDPNRLIAPQILSDLLQYHQQQPTNYPHLSFTERVCHFSSEPSELINGNINSRGGRRSESVEVLPQKPVQPKVVRSNSTSSASGTRRPKQAKRACYNCRQSCKKCDDQRPCIRCITLGVEDTCKDVPKKPRPIGMKRGPYKKSLHQIELINRANAITDEMILDHELRQCGIYLNQ